MLSQKTILIIFFSTILLLIAFAIYYQFKFIKLSKKTKLYDFPQPPVIATYNPKSTPVNPNLSLDQKIGQVLMSTIQGLELSEGERVEMREGSLSNILLMGKNIKDEEQLKTLTNSIYQEATFSGIKPFIAVDQEGGKVSRITWIESTAQNEIKTDEQAYNIAWIRGQQLKNLGINLNLAPVIEVAGQKSSFIANQKRIFASDSAQLAKAMVGGYREAGIIPVIKHYPAGLARTTIDPHLQLPKIIYSQDEFIQDIIGFGKVNAPGLMVTHLVYPALDASPSSASSFFIQQILRQDLDFSGLVISDDLSMKAISDNYNIGEYGIGSLEAGVDMLIVGGFGDMEMIKKEIRDYCVTRDCSKLLDEHVGRVLKLKRTLK